jgi:hypothetical protein
MIFSRTYRHEHRGLLHTPVGVTLATLLVFCYAGIFSSLFLHAVGFMLFLISGSFWAGCMLHLLQDSCTPTGIAWGFPLRNGRLRGNIRTVSPRDPRPTLYAGMLVGCLVILFLLRDLSFPPSWLIATLILIGVWSLFLIVARSTQGTT